MKTPAPRLIVCFLTLSLSASLAPAQWDNGDHDRDSPFGFFDFVLMLMRQPALAVRAAQANDAITATVTREQGNVYTTVNLARPESTPVTIATTTTRSGQGFSASATVTRANSPAPLQIGLTVTRDNGTVSNQTTITTPAGHVLGLTQVFEPQEDDQMDVTSTFTRNHETVRTVTRTVPTPRPPPRRGR